MREQIIDFMTPSLLIDLMRMENNVKRKAERVEHCEEVLSLHSKTHKCIEIECIT